MNAFELARILAARARLDASRHVDAPRSHGSIAIATFSGVSPPASMTRMPSGAPSASAQSNTSPDPGAGESTRIASAPYVAARSSARVARGERLDHERDSRRDVASRLGCLVPVQLRGAAARPCARSRPPARAARRGTRRPSSPRAADGERCRARPAGAICRGDGAKTNPTASAPSATASSASSSLVMPQILTNIEWRSPRRRSRRPWLKSS